MAVATEHRSQHFSCATDSLGGTSIGSVSSFSLAYNNNATASFKGGSRATFVIGMGNIEISGSLTLYFVDKTQVLDLVTTDPVADDTLYVRGASGVTSDETIDITINNVKWNNWNFEYGSDGAPVLETCDFLAKTITVAETTQ